MYRLTDLKLQQKGPKFQPESFSCKQRRININLTLLKMDAY